MIDYSYSPFEGADGYRRLLAARPAGAGAPIPYDPSPEAAGFARRSLSEFERAKRERHEWPAARRADTADALARATPRDARIRERLDLLNGLLKVGDLPDVSGPAAAAEREAFAALLRSLPAPDRTSPAPEEFDPGLGRVRDLGILVARGPRARRYLETLRRAGVRPAAAVLLGPDPMIPDAAHARAGAGEAAEEEILRAEGIPFEEAGVRRVGRPETLARLRAAKIRNWIYSGGGILPPTHLETGLRFLHVHPGLLPEERGSTVPYFTVLSRGGMGASGFRLAAALDRGPIFVRRAFRVPATTDWDFDYDPRMRADVLLRALGPFLEGAESDPAPAEGVEYTIVHPILKHLALLWGAQGELP